MTDIADIRLAQGAKEFIATKTRLAVILGAIAEEIEDESQALIDSSDPPAFADLVHSVAEGFAEASARWSALSKLIREQHWT